MKVLLKNVLLIKKKENLNILLRIHQTIKHTCSRVEFYSSARRKKNVFFYY